MKAAIPSVMSYLQILNTARKMSTIATFVTSQVGKRWLVYENRRASLIYFFELVYLSLLLKYPFVFAHLLNFETCKRIKYSV